MITPQVKYVHIATVFTFIKILLRRLCNAIVVHINAARVCLETDRVNVSRNGTASIYLSSNIVVAGHATVLRKSYLRIAVDGVASSVRIAVHACVNGRALHVLSLILLAGNIGNTAVAVDPSIGSVGITSIARSCTTAVDESLDRRNDLSLLALRSDLDSVGDGRQRSMRPAADEEMLYKRILHMQIIFKK